MKIVFYLSIGLILVSSKLFAPPTAAQTSLFKALGEALNVDDTQIPKPDKQSLFNAIVPLLHPDDLKKPLFLDRAASELNLNAKQVQDRIAQLVPQNKDAYIKKFNETIDQNAMPIAQGFKGKVAGLAGDAVTKAEREQMSAKVRAVADEFAKP